MPPIIKKPSTFASFFRLKNSSRTNLTLDPQRDSALYIDLQGTVGQIIRGLQDTPRVVIEGDIGTGKSHALFFAADYVQKNSLPFKPIYTTLSGFESRTNFISGIHRPVMGKLLDFFDSEPAYFQQMVAPRAGIEELPSLVQKALVALRQSASARGEARAWLTASRTLTPSKAIKAGYPQMLDEVCQPADLASLYVRLAKMWQQTTNQRILLLIDEGESFTRVVNEDAQASIGAGLRQMFDSTNQSLGFFIGLNTPRTRKGTHPMLRSDVRSRARTISLPTLQDPKLREQFLNDFWGNVSNMDLKDFVDKNAKRFLLHDLDLVRRSFLRDLQLASPTPRDLLAVLDIIAQNAFGESKKLPLDEGTLRSWVGILHKTHAEMLDALSQKPVLVSSASWMAQCACSARWSRT